MKMFIRSMVAVVLAAMTLAACGTAPQESAMDWMKRQPTSTR